MIFLSALAPVVHVILGENAPRQWVRHSMCFRKVNDLQTSQNHEVSEDMYSNLNYDKSSSKTSKVDENKLSR
jgi:hypothetical protein